MVVMCNDNTQLYVVHMKWKIESKFMYTMIKYYNYFKLSIVVIEKVKEKNTFPSLQAIFISGRNAVQ